MIRRFVLILALLAVTACTAPTEVAGLDTRFTPESPIAIVVIGMQRINPPVTGPLLGREIVPWARLTWARIEKDAAGKPVLFHSQPEEPGQALPSYQGRMHYTVYSVAPGRYALTEINTALRMDNIFGTRFDASNGAFAFDAPAGQVTYIGNIYINAVPGHKATILYAGHDDAAAAAALKSYPEVKGELHYSAPVPWQAPAPENTKTIYDKY